jgi:hypothetical protein
MICGMIPNSNKLPDTIYETTGLYAWRTETAIRCGHRTSGNCDAVWLTAIEAIDINTQEDLDFARIVAAGLKATDG